MRPVVDTIAGREVELRLTLDGLDQVAAVNPQFGEIAAAFETKVWDWREVKAILGVALRPHGMTMEHVYQDRGVEGCRALAARVFAAAMPKPAGNDEAAAEGGDPQPSRSKST